MPNSYIFVRNSFLESQEITVVDHWFLGIEPSSLDQIPATPLPIHTKNCIVTRVPTYMCLGPFFHHQWVDGFAMENPRWPA